MHLSIGHFSCCCIKWVSESYFGQTNSMSYVGLCCFMAGDRPTGAAHGRFVAELGGRLWYTGNSASGPPYLAAVRPGRATGNLDFVQRWLIDPGKGVSNPGST